MRRELPDSCIHELLSSRNRRAAARHCDSLSKLASLPRHRLHCLLPLNPCPFPYLHYSLPLISFPLPLLLSLIVVSIIFCICFPSPLPSPSLSFAFYRFHMSYLHHLLHLVALHSPPTFHTIVSIICFLSLAFYSFSLPFAFYLSSLVSSFTVLIHFKSSSPCTF